MGINSRLARIENGISRQMKKGRGGFCKCNYGLVVDFGDGKAEYPPERGGICPKCGRKYKGSQQILVIRAIADETAAARQLEKRNL